MKPASRFLLFSLIIVTVLTLEISLSHAAANLVVTLVSGPIQANLNETVAVTYRVKNTGDAESGAYEVGLYLSKDKIIDPAADRLLRKVPFATGLGAGASLKTTSNVTIPTHSPDGTAVGNFYYGAVVELSAKASSKQAKIIRFTDNGDGTVTDYKSGLMWQKSDNGTATTWVEAAPYCNDLELGGHADWLLPDVSTLVTTVNYSKSDPAIHNVFDGRSNAYWSSSTYAADPDYAWYVVYLGGGVHLLKKNSSDGYVRCVRSGPDPWAL
jgi:hypothetical protein